MAKEAEEKIRVANSERDSAVRALEENRALTAMRENAVREEAGLQIIKYEMTFRRSALFMVKEKYLDLDFSDINFSDMKGHDSADPSASNNTALVQPVEEAPQAEGVFEVEGVQGEIIEGDNNVTPESGENESRNIVVIPSD